MSLPSFWRRNYQAKTIADLEYHIAVLMMH